MLPFLHTTSVDVNVFLHPLSSKVSMLTFAITTCFSQKQTTDTLGGMEEIPNDGHGLVLTSATMYMYILYMYTHVVQLNEVADGLYTWNIWYMYFIKLD